MTYPPRVWDGVLRRLGADLSAVALDAWVRPLSLEGEGETARLVCPTEFHRDRVRRQIHALVELRMAEELGERVPLNLVVGTPSIARAIADPSEPDPEARSEGPAIESRRAPSRRSAAGALSSERVGVRRVSRSRLPGIPADGARSTRGRHGRPEVARAETRTSPEQLAFTFDTFVVGTCNALAREAALALAQARQERLNLLYLTAQPGLGKTHLARAVAYEAQRCGDRRVVYATAETFTGDFTSSLRAKAMDRFKRHYRRNDVLVFEDVQFLSGKKSTQLELFHTLVHLLDTGARVVFTGDRMPRDIENLDGRLRSQMASGLVAEIEAPDAAVRRRILGSKAAAGGVKLPDDCLDLMVDNLRGNVRDLTGVLVQLVATASLLKRPIDLDLTRAALYKVAPDDVSRRRLQPEDVVDAVAAFFGMPPDGLAARSKRAEVLFPRQVAMYLCRRYTDANLPRIAKCFRRQHPAVANAEKVIERQILEKPKVRYQVEAISVRLDAREKRLERARG